MHKTAIVLLNWNGKYWLERFLPSLLQCTPLEGAEFIVADNASGDDSLQFLSQHYPTVRQITLEQNYGFAQGYNKALEQVEAEYFVLLNTDVQVTPGWLSPLIDYLETHPQVAALQPKVRSYHNPQYFEYAGAAGGFMDAYGYPYCRGRILDTVEKDNGQYDSPIPIFWATGACMVIRSSVFRKLGGFDPSFFAHMEEIDLCWRIHKSGMNIYCLPNSTVYHVGGGTLSADTPYKTYLNFRNNLLMLYKNLSPDRRYKVLWIRMILDYVAALTCLFTGNWEKAKAIRKARQDFRKMKRQYVLQPAEAEPQYTTPSLKGLILWSYYIARKRKFSEIA